MGANFSRVKYLQFQGGDLTTPVFKNAREKRRYARKKMCQQKKRMRPQKYFLCYKNAASNKITKLYATAQ